MTGGDALRRKQYLMRKYGRKWHNRWIEASMNPHGCGVLFKKWVSDGKTLFHSNGWKWE
jgi:hypothetical protein